MKQSHLLIVIALILAGASYYYYSQNYLTQADRTAYEIQCRDWIRKEFGNGKAAVPLDAYKKRGHPVFRFAIAQDNSSSSTIFTCVVDTDAGTLIKPSAFDQSWRK